jgi:hypothetical protein
MPMNPVKQEQVADHLAAALDAILAAAVLVVGLPDDIPDDALDAALGGDEGVQKARRSVQDALQNVSKLGVKGEPYLGLEADVNALAARCAEAGFRVGVRVGRGLR